jgi:hypothetical protein
VFGGQACQWKRAEGTGSLALGERKLRG